MRVRCAPCGLCSTFSRSASAMVRYSRRPRRCSSTSEPSASAARAHRRSRDDQRADDDQRRAAAVSSALATPAFARPEHDEPAGDEAGERGPAQRTSSACSPPAHQSALRGTAAFCFSSDAIRSPSLRLLRSSDERVAAVLAEQLAHAMSSSRSSAWPRSSSSSCSACSRVPRGSRSAARCPARRTRRTARAARGSAFRGTPPPASRR